MDRYPNRQIGPICKFGPGGDFISIWPSEQSSQFSTNRLTKLLASLNKIIDKLVGPESYTDLAVPTDIQTTAGLVLADKEKLEYAASNGADEPAYTTPITIIKSNSRFSAEPMLFADDCRIGIATIHQPKHSIRAYRRTAKKRSALGLCLQGSLFEINLKSA